MAAADPTKTRTGGTPPEDGRRASDPFGTAEFQDKLERARQRRAKALGQSTPDPAEPPESPAPDVVPDPVPEAEPRPALESNDPAPRPPLLVLGAAARPAPAEPEAEPAPAPAAPLTAPRRSGARRARAPRRGRRVLAVWIVALTGAATVASLVVALRSAPPTPTPDPLPVRDFAVDSTAPEGPVPPQGVPTPEAPAMPSAEGAPAGPGPAPETPAVPVLAPPPEPPSPALAEWADTPVRLLGIGDGSEVASGLREAGLEKVTARAVDFTPATSVVRFFDAADRPLATALAERVGAEVQDLTSYDPPPEAPGVEVWLAAP